jgi:hypothetical protein
MDALELVLDYHREQARQAHRHESSTIREIIEFAAP